MRAAGREGVAALVERHHAQAQRVGEALSKAGFEVLNRVMINQVLFRCATDEAAHALRTAIQASGETWFAGTMWQGRAALRISVSSWRTRDSAIDALVKLIVRLGATPAR